MNLLNKFSNLVNPVDPEENYDENDYMFDNQDNNDFNVGYNDGGYTQQASQQNAQQPMPQPRRNVSMNNMQSQVPLQQQDGAVSINGSDLEIKVVYPVKWDDAFDIADHLISHRTVVVNLERNKSAELCRQIIYFLIGVTYTIQGDLKKIATNTWLATPNNVVMSQEKVLQRQQQMNRMQSNDVYDTDML